MFGVDPKAEMWKLPAEHVGHYAEQDARLTYLLWQHFKHIINKESLDTVKTVEKKWWLKLDESKPWGEILEEARRRDREREGQEMQVDR